MYGPYHEYVTNRWPDDYSSASPCSHPCTHPCICPWPRLRRGGDWIVGTPYTIGDNVKFSKELAEMTKLEEAIITEQKKTTEHDVKLSEKELKQRAYDYEQKEFKEELKKILEKKVPKWMTYDFLSVRHTREVDMYAKHLLTTCIGFAVFHLPFAAKFAIDKCYGNCTMSCLDNNSFGKEVDGKLQRIVSGSPEECVERALRFTATLGNLVEADIRQKHMFG